LWRIAGAIYYQQKKNLIKSSLWEGRGFVSGQEGKKGGTQSGPEGKCRQYAGLKRTLNTQEKGLWKW